MKDRGKWNLKAADEARTTMFACTYLSFFENIYILPQSGNCRNSILRNAGGRSVFRSSLTFAFRAKQGLQVTRLWKHLPPSCVYYFSSQRAKSKKKEPPRTERATFRTQYWNSTLRNAAKGEFPTWVPSLQPEPEARDECRNTFRQVAYSIFQYKFFFFFRSFCTHQPQQRLRKCGQSQ